MKHSIDSLDPPPQKSLFVGRSVSESVCQKAFPLGNKQQTLLNLPDMTDIVLSARRTRTVLMAVKFAMFGAIVIYLWREKFIKKAELSSLS